MDQENEYSKKLSTMQVALLDEAKKKRFDSYIDRNGPIPGACPDLGRCWIWIGYQNERGYGVFQYTKKRTLYSVMAHVMSCASSGRVKPLGLQSDHLCRIRCCVNPDHIEFVTPSINTIRARRAESTKNSLKVFCKRGHPLSGSNLQEYGLRNRQRICIACVNLRQRTRMAAKRSCGGCAGERGSTPRYSSTVE